MSDYLPEDVLINILKRLLPISLIKLRCVSKSWNSLISSPYFISQQSQQAVLSDYLATHTNHLVISRYPKDRGPKIYSVNSDSDEFHEDENIRIRNPFLHLERFCYRIVGSLNGVLCISDDFIGHNHSVFLWNPAIRRKVVLPLPNETVESRGPCMCVLGFGFDVKNNDYKVVRVAGTINDCANFVRPKVEVYALSSRTWRGISGKFPPSWIVDQSWSQAFLNGNVHWIAYRPKAREDQPKTTIVMFNLSNEVFDEMQLPDALKNDFSCRFGISILEQFLTIYNYDNRVMYRKSCSIWVMKKYGDVQSWSKLFNVDLEGRLGKVLGMRKNGDILLTADNQLIAYNPDRGTQMELGIHGDPYLFCAWPYVETLDLLVEGEEAHGGECGPSKGKDVELSNQVAEMYHRMRSCYDAMREERHMQFLSEHENFCSYICLNF